MSPPVLRKISIDYVEENFGGSLYDDLFGLLEDYDHTKYTFFTSEQENTLVAKYEGRTFLICSTCHTAWCDRDCPGDEEFTWEEVPLASGTITED